MFRIKKNYKFLNVASYGFALVGKRATATDEPETLLTQLRGTTYTFR